MNIRKLLDWRKLLIYSHRWLGIVILLMFLVWTLSGVVLMYYGHPQLTTGERLYRLDPIDFSTATLTPSEAAAIADYQPNQVRISMLGGRPVYRFTQSGFGNWPVVYADTGEQLDEMDREEAMAWMREFVPEHADTMTYDAYLESPDEFTRIPTYASYVPLHRIAMNDGAGTEYYVSAQSNDVVMKADRNGRILAFSGYILHNLFFFRQQPWWTTFLDYVAWTAMIMALSGIVLGIWRVALKPRFRHKGVPSYTPYSGWMKWHHYAGLIFGLFSITWILSGMIPITTFPWPGWSQVSKRIEANGSGHIMGNPGVSPRSTMAPIAQAITGGPFDLEQVELDNLKAAIAQIGESFAPKELEILQFRGEPYLLAFEPPTTEEAAANWNANNSINMVNVAQDNPHLFVSLRNPENGVMEAFPRKTMEQASLEAMPDAQVIDSEWLTEYDDYYHQTVPSFELGRHKPAYVLPVLRVRYDDPNQTWLYFAPSLGQLVRFEDRDRTNRWLYYGLHAMDWPGLLYRRPLWDIVTLLLLSGLAAMSITSLWPAYLRLQRHAIRWWKKVFVPKKLPAAPRPGFAVSDRSRTTGD